MSTDERETFDDLRNAPTSLPSTNVAYTLEQVSRLIEQFSIVAEKANQLEDELRQLKPKSQTTEILDQLIEPYAKRTYWFMVGYCGFVGLMLFISSLTGSDVHIEPDVMKILVGSTAVTVIGLSA